MGGIGAGRMGARSAGDISPIVRTGYTPARNLLNMGGKTFGRSVSEIAKGKGLPLDGA